MTGDFDFNWGFETKQGRPGELATRYSLRDRKIDVLVRAQEKDRGSVESIRNLLVNPSHLPPIKLAALANVSVEMGPGEIHRVGQERVALVRTNIIGHDLGKAAEAIQEIIQSIQIPEQFNVQVSGQNKEMAVSFRSLQFALLLAVFLVYLVMASQFESLLHPFVIMFTIPLALIGVVLALMVTGSSLSVVVFIGLIMLAGIVNMITNEFKPCSRFQEPATGWTPIRRRAAKTGVS